MSENDVKDASTGVLQDLKRFQKDKETDLRRYMVCLMTRSDMAEGLDPSCGNVNRLL